MKVRTAEEKMKDIKIAVLEHHIEQENQSKKRNKMVVVYSFRSFSSWSFI